MDLMYVILAERALAAFKGIRGHERPVVLVVSNIDGHGKRQLWDMLLMDKAGYIRL